MGEKTEEVSRLNERAADESTSRERRSSRRPSGSGEQGTEAWTHEGGRGRREGEVVKVRR